MEFIFRIRVVLDAESMGGMGYDSILGMDICGDLMGSGYDSILGIEKLDTFGDAIRSGCESIPGIEN